MRAHIQDIRLFYMLINSLISVVCAGLFGQHQQPQAHVIAALQKQAEALMAQHQRNTMAAAAAAAAAQSRPGSAHSSGQPVLTGQPLIQGHGSAQPRQQSNQQPVSHPGQAPSQAQQQSSSLPGPQQLLQQQISQLAQQYRQVHPAPTAPQQQSRPP